MTQAKPEEAVGCPYCNAVAGQRCVKANGDPVGQFSHGRRRDLAIIEGFLLPITYISEESRREIARWKASQRESDA